MALMCPATSEEQVDRHSEAFTAAVEEIFRMTEQHRSTTGYIPDEGATTGEKGLKATRDGSSTASSSASRPPPSPTAGRGAGEVIGGVQAPAVLLASFVPMFLIASAFYYMNHADPDCGTSFSDHAGDGPGIGWVGGWAVATTGILVIGSLAQVAAFAPTTCSGSTRCATPPSGTSSSRC